MRSRSVAYMVASAVGFSTMSALVKLASATIPTGQIVLCRAAITLALSYVMVRRAGLSPFGTQHGKLIQRGVLGFAALSAYYISVGLLPLADASTLQQTIPLLTAVLAWWILDEPIGWGAAVAIACGFGGVVLIIHPSTGAAHGPGVAIALAGACMSSAAYVTVRQLARTEHPLIIVFYFPLVSVPLALPWAAANWIWPRATEWLILLGIGAATQVGQVYLTRALAIERAGRVTAVGYLQICFAVVWQLMLFGVWPSLGTVAGAALIIAGTVAVSAAGRAGQTRPIAE